VVAVHDAGADSYLAKPFTAPQLREKIDVGMLEWTKQKALYPAVNKIIDSSSEFYERGENPVIVLAEPAASRAALLHAGAPTEDCLTAFVEALDSSNSEHLDLGASLALVVLSVKAGGTPVAAARMLGRRTTRRAEFSALAATSARPCRYGWSGRGLFRVASTSFQPVASTPA
jgi:hypothetical protein